MTQNKLNYSKSLKRVLEAAPHFAKSSQHNQIQSTDILLALTWEIEGGAAHSDEEEKERLTGKNA